MDRYRFRSSAGCFRNLLSAQERCEWNFPRRSIRLFYYRFPEGWISAGKQTASDHTLVFHRVPAGTLYWLRNKTTGIEERIFTWEKGEARFWWIRKLFFLQSLLLVVKLSLIMINVELEFFIPYELCYKYVLLDSGIDKKILVMRLSGWSRQPPPLQFIIRSPLWNILTWSSCVFLYFPAHRNFLKENML